jgi:WD repeat-containing protein 1 (actin-interacting protein 1)
VTPKGDFVAVGAEDTETRIYKTHGSTKLELFKALNLNRSAISALAFSLNGTYLAVGDASGKIIVYESGEFGVSELCSLSFRKILTVLNISS